MLVGHASEIVTGHVVVSAAASLPIAATFLLFAVASLVPIAKGVPRKGAKEFGSPLTFLTSDREVTVGRVAMLVRRVAAAAVPVALSQQCVKFVLYGVVACRNGEYF